MLKRDDIFTGTVTRAVCCGSLLEELYRSYSHMVDQARWTR
jgi:hypothetical protein